MVSRSQSADSLAQLTGELKNFQDIARYIMPLPGEIPTLADIDVYGDTIPLNGVVGGDHIIYVDFKKRYDLRARIQQAAAAGKAEVVANLERCKSKAGIVLLDVSGHLATDASRLIVASAYTITQLKFMGRSRNAIKQFIAHSVELALGARP